MMGHMAKAYLARYRAALVCLRQADKLARDRYADMMARAQGLGGQAGGGVGGTSAQGDAMQRAVAAAIDARARSDAQIAEMRAQCERELSRVLALITLVQAERPDLGAVLTARYVQGRSWARIARDLHVSTQTAYRMHARALGMCDRILAGMPQDESP